MTNKTWVETLHYPTGIMKWVYKSPILLYRLGLGHRPIPRVKLKLQAMSDALVQMKSPEMCAKAAALGEKIRQEDGVTVAIQLIQDNVWRHYSGK